MPQAFGDPANPLYFWEVVAAPVPNGAAAARWPQGGLVRIRARDPKPPPNTGSGILTTFDAINQSCLTSQPPGSTWEAIGTACEGTGGKVATFVSTTNVPQTVEFGFLGKKPEITEAETNEYYGAIGAPKTLTKFKTKYGFGGTEIQATYYNDGDLGLGREMHCKAFPGAGGNGIACYVTNYSGVDDTAVFGGNPVTVLADAVARTSSFATVAMVYDPPAGSPNSVKFMVYDANDNLTPVAQLDSTGSNLSVPTNCMNCHGVDSSYNAGTNKVTGAQFLPFDPFSFKYSTAPGFTEAEMGPHLRQLNALVTLTAPPSATMELIAGMYAPNLVTSPVAVANNDFVPDAWADALPGLDGVAIYRGVVKVGCRTCHVSATNAALDFAQESDWSGPLKAVLLNDVCSPLRSMPQAERVMKKFWQSGARAYLTSTYKSGVYPDPIMACKP